MKIVSINDKLIDKDTQESKQKENMLEVIEYMRKEIESGEIKEFVAASVDADGVAQIHISALDLPGSVGLFEIGKHLLISQETGL